MLEDRRFPSLASIRAFEAAARHGGFAQAAKELATSAASVSYHVRQLELQIGAPLFRRLPHKVELTAAGSLIAQEATRAFDALRASFVRAAETDEARLSLTALPSLGAAWLTPRLGAFRKRHPRITLELDLSERAQDLTDGRFDAAVRNGHGRWPGLRATPLFPAIFLPLCQPGLKPAEAELLNGDVPLLGRQDWWALWFAAFGRPPPAPGRFGARLAHEHLDIAAAVAGQGVAIGSPLVFRGELEAGRLVPAHDRVVGDGRSFWFVYPVARQASAKIGACRDWMIEEARTEREACAGLLGRAVIYAAD